MRTFWAWRVVEDSRAGLPKQRVARILCARNPKRAGQKLTTILSIFRILFCSNPGMLADNMPDQLIVKAFGDIPEELVDVEKLLQEAGLSGAGPERPKRKRYTEYELRKRLNDTYPDIPEEPIDIEILIEDAGLSCAGLERPKRKRCSEYDLRKRVNDTRPDIPIDVETLIEEAGYTENDLFRDDMEDRFVNVQMVNQELQDQLDLKQVRIANLEKFLKQADENLAYAVRVAERDARIDADRAAASSLHEQNKELCNYERQITCIHRQAVDARNNFLTAKETLNILTNGQADFATRLHNRGQVAMRISLHRRNRMARAIRHAYNQMVKEDEDSGVSTPEQDPDDQAP